MNSCYKTITDIEAESPNIVKVVTDDDNMALYFSRSKIPYSRDHNFNGYRGHIGIYGFTKRSLKRFCGLSDSPLERIEKLEQLRTLYHGYKVAMVEVESQSFGIDTPEDLERALNIKNY
jgi:3-deoxy-manno-octulosonate cytidylyltransferase (CMP-KDO synthetase)